MLIRPCLPSSFRIKIPYPLQWGAPTFNAGHAFGMMAAVLVSLIEVLYSSTLAIFILLALYLKKYDRKFVIV